jgi:hypothetical protein
MAESSVWALVRVSRVVSKIKLPRPKVVRTVIQTGTYDECMEAQKKIKTSLKPIDQSSEDIKVEFTVIRHGRRTTKRS